MAADVGEFALHSRDHAERDDPDRRSLVAKVVKYTRCIPG